ncbi:peptidoglycan bridge formation glycyltransferase FemA/FemB family protein [Candidatus Woesebacteria bacterium]|nr:MAG: peptidoglycan bridge formation glycyltransferase FemA/FemB family protein [Candidatus Woesebacteria bacterium]
MWDIRQDAKFANYLTTLNWNVDEIGNDYIYSKKLPFLGLSIIKIQRPSKIIPNEAISSVCVKRRGFLVYVEPRTKEQSVYYLNHGFVVCKTPSLPTKTIRINLHKSEKELLTDMHYKTRYNVSLSTRKGLSLGISRDIELFARNWQNCAKERGMWISQKREINNIYASFGKRAHVLLANLNTNNVGGILLIFSNKVGYYMYAYSTQEGKKLSAPTFLAWNAILYSKEKQNNYFDFEGIFDERYPLKSWKGFTRFKKSFGGEVIDYPGIYSKYYNPYKLPMVYNRTHD